MSAQSMQPRGPGNNGKALAADEREDDKYFADEAEARPQSSVETRLQERNGGAAAPLAGFGADAEVDSLDAFMAEINAEVAKANDGSAKKKSNPDELRAEDPVASYFSAWEKGESYKLNDDGDIDNGPGGAVDEKEEAAKEVESRKNKAIEPLPRMDHDKIKYPEMPTVFYKPHAEVSQLTSEQVDKVREELKISATGAMVPAPTVSFGQLEESLGKELMRAIKHHGFLAPTPIQAQSIPAALSGRDVIGIAETGTGKTIAYLLPMLVHCMGQPELKRGEGPIGLVICPTRELAVQIEDETRKLNKSYGLKSCTLAGGFAKTDQFKEIKRGAEIVICNPGRLIDIVQMKGCNLHRVTFVILDEADRMFSLGFEYQMRSIVQNVRPIRQIMMFSATFPPKVEKLAHDILNQPIRITCGHSGQMAAAVLQHTEALHNDDEKWGWLSKRIEEMRSKGQVLIFVKSIESAEELTQNFREFLDIETEFLHGDLDQTERMRILKMFRKQDLDVLIATDVAARGLDLPAIKTVVSYDVARDVETHTHRIGRTGRGGLAGEAYTLMTSTEENKKMAANIAELMEIAGQTVSDSLSQLAMRYGPYRTAKLAGQKFVGKKKAGGGPQVHSACGVGFDLASGQKETVQDLEKRLNREADQLVQINRSIMSGTNRPNRRAGLGGTQMSVAAKGKGKAGHAGFVAQVTEEVKIVIPKPVIPDSDSDDDLFAPGVAGAFGKKLATDKDTKGPEAAAGGQAWDKSAWAEKDAEQSWDKSGWVDKSQKSGWVDKDQNSGWVDKASSQKWDSAQKTGWTDKPSQPQSSWREPQVSNPPVEQDAYAARFVQQQAAQPVDELDRTFDIEAQIAQAAAYAQQSRSVLNGSNTGDRGGKNSGFGDKRSRSRDGDSRLLNSGRGDRERASHRSRSREKESRRSRSRRRRSPSRSRSRRRSRSRSRRRRSRSRSRRR